ncbi:hypothetical protein MFLO_15164 [Listeria floridensis FSL S10-1187]|uniref:Uncharacterized protein n=1 Tax=Listeria floridensis FSL S10-1187 TaxID=1265817 RepID=A0ABN0RBQ4_9LIST|nr:hypothetical protein [Listeria floridensis]EUJ25588.1 hypothetical protein MFLO_15164 [Listeria floridensis FSL S10-1187]
MKNLTSIQKTLVIAGLVSILSDAILGIVFNQSLAVVAVLGVIQLILSQAVCYIWIYAPLKVEQTRRMKLFSLGIVITIILAALIAFLVPANFRSYSGAIIALLSYVGAILMREVEHTNPANKKTKE